MPENPGAAAPEQIIIERTIREIVQPPIDGRTAFCFYAAAAVAGLCAANRPTSKEQGEEIVAYAHWLANRMLEGPQAAPEGGEA